MDRNHVLTRRHLIRLAGGTALAAVPALRLADEAAAVSDAVVNISATQRVEAKRQASNGEPDAQQQGTPFDDLFDEFFRKRVGGLKRQLEAMREGGRITAACLEMLKVNVRPGVTTRELDRLAEEKLAALG